MSGQRRPPDPTILVKRPIEVDSGVPPKRRKFQNALNAPEGLQLSPKPISSVKREPSLTPPPSLAPRTSGTVRLNIPRDCLKTQANWHEKRAKWVAEETSKLKDRGLKVLKRLIREDGLALDWISPVPVCPLTLRPPIEVLPDMQVHQTQQDPSKVLPVDLLGHALHDQLLSSRLSSTSGPESSVQIQLDAPRKNGCKSLPKIPDNDGRVVSDFPVVGAATRKEPEGSASERATETVSNSTVQWDHRKLLPPDLRPSTQFRYISKDGAKDRKARRLAWIAKEVEKVEGYTGEKVAGFRYDGDDVVIYLSKAVYFARRRQEQGTGIPVGPPRLDRRPLAPPTGPRATRITDPPAITPRKNFTEGPTLSCSQPSVNLGSSMTAVCTSSAPRVVPMLPVISQVTENVSSPSERSTSKPSILDGTSSLTASTSHSSEAVTQARGLGFLERYLQLFDSDREALSLAYTPNATFSLTEEKYDNNDDAPRHLPQIVKIGRSAIVEMLKKIIPDRHHSPSADIAYNIATLDDLSTGGLLLTCEGTLIPIDRPIQKERYPWHFSRIFVLKQNDEGGRQSWPMQIAAERLTIHRKVK